MSLAWVDGRHLSVTPAPASAEAALLAVSARLLAEAPAETALLTKAALTAEASAKTTHKLVGQ